jgi:subtilisin family serine protease
MTFGRAAISCIALTTMALAACGGGGGGSSPGAPVVAPVITPTVAPTTAPTTSPTTGPVSAAAYVCPASQSATTSVARSSTAANGTAAFAVRRAGTAPATPATALLAVTYDTATATRSAQSIGANETRAGATLVRSLPFDALGTTVHIVAVPAAGVTAATAALRAQAGVQRVDPTGHPAFAFTVTAPTYPNDPYFNGFQTTVAPSGGTPPPATYRVSPYAESQNVPGQWGLHAVKLEYAFSYASANSAVNGSNAFSAGALGSSGVKIAIIDTGEDANHPELASKIVYQHCFITNNSGVQSTGTFATDPQGHGTDVTGIAAAATGNGLGFTGAGGATTIYAYRVFPTPVDACQNAESSTATPNPQCTASTADIASAISDATNQGVNIISMSLGGLTTAGTACTNGQDPDTLQGAAVANAIKKGIIVIAASGNSGKGAVAAPACDTGVIAVGATALADGQTNGSGVLSGTAALPVEYVPSYSDYGSPAAAVRQPAAWGIVAPGGDPHTDPNANDTTGATADNDDLHWIENVWTTTPFDATFSAAPCQPDYASTSGPADCRALIAGTSMATPLVAGAAALIVAAAPSYQNPTLMKQLLCTTADDIGDPHEGCGRLNVYRAMATALGDAAPP